MDLNQLAQFIGCERKKFEEAIKKEARRLRLKDIIKEIDFHPISYAWTDFQDGMPLKFVLCQGRYTVTVDKKELVLRESYDIELARFTGRGVNRYYSSLSSAIKREEKENPLPF